MGKDCRWPLAGGLPKACPEPGDGQMVTAGRGRSAGVGGNGHFEAGAPGGIIRPGALRAGAVQGLLCKDYFARITLQGSFLNAPLLRLASKLSKHWSTAGAESGGWRLFAIALHEARLGRPRIAPGVSPVSFLTARVIWD